MFSTLDIHLARNILLVLLGTLWYGTTRRFVEIVGQNKIILKCVRTTLYSL